MRLYLSEHSPLNSKFSTEVGQVLYKVETPHKLWGRIATISRVIPNDSREGEPDMQDRYAPLATIEFKTMKPSTIQFGEYQVDTNTYFRKGSLGAFGRDRVFTAPDDREYRWRLGLQVPELMMNDTSNTSVAKFHTSSLGIIGRSKPACLEVFPAGEHILDTILVTFVYIEKLRKDRERDATVPGSGY